MRTYEFVIIYRATLNDSDLNSEIERFEKLARDNGATEVLMNNWGKRESAYPMNKEKFGNYVSFGLATDNYQLVSELSNILRINDQVLKFQSHRVNEPAKEAAAA